MIKKKDEQLIVALAKEGLTAYVIGTKFGISADDVKVICNRHNTPVKGYKIRVAYTEALEERIRVMIKSERYSQRFIAKALGVQKTRVKELQAEMGYTIEGSVFAAKRNRMQRLAAKVEMLKREGMMVKCACHVVGISPSSYHIHKKAATF